VTAEDPGDVGEGLARQWQRGTVGKQRSPLVSGWILVDRLVTRSLPRPETTRHTAIRLWQGLPILGWKRSTITHGPVRAGSEIPPGHPTGDGFVDRHMILLGSGGVPSAGRTARLYI